MYICIFLISYSTEQTQSYTRAYPKYTLCLLSWFFGGLLWVCFLKVCVHSGFTFGLLGVYFAITQGLFFCSMFALKCEADSLLIIFSSNCLYFLPLVYSKYTCSVWFQEYTSDRE